MSEEIKTTENKETKPAKKMNDPWKDMRTIRLPRGGLKEQNFREVAVNGRFFQVPRGREVEVPAPVAEALKLAGESADHADDRKAEMAQAAKEPVYR